MLLNGTARAQIAAHFCAQNLEMLLKILMQNSNVLIQFFQKIL